MENQVRKIFVVGSQTGYASWMEGTLVSTMEEADLVVFTGGEDINPSIYGERQGRYTHYNERRDQHELLAMAKAITLGKYIWGTCRGAQLMCAYNGGKVIQDVSHPSWHKFTAYDGKEYDVTSCHHQMLNVVSSTVRTYVLGYTKGLSPHHTNGNGNSVTSDLPVYRTTPGRRSHDDFAMEPEIVYFDGMKGNSKASGLCIQGHPEWMDKDSQTIVMLRTMLTQWMNPEKISLYSKLYPEDDLVVSPSFHQQLNNINESVMGNDFDEEEEEYQREYDEDGNEF